MPIHRLFVQLSGRRLGPFAEDAVAQMIAEGQISRDTLVWAEGMEEWTKAGDLPELAGALAAGVKREGGGEKAPLGQRLLAWAIDGAVLAALILVSVKILGWFFGMESVDPLAQPTGSAPIVNRAWAMQLLPVLPCLYLALGISDTFKGQTIGLRVAKLRQVAVDGGGPLNWDDSPGRIIAHAVLCLILFPVAWITVPFDARGRSLVGMISKSFVVRA